MRDLHQEVKPSSLRSQNTEPVALVKSAGPDAHPLTMAPITRRECESANCQYGLRS